MKWVAFAGALLMLVGANLWLVHTTREAIRVEQERCRTALARELTWTDARRLGRTTRQEPLPEDACAALLVIRRGR